MVDLGNNNLSGKIPTWIDQSLKNLVILRLRSNEFNGIIPFSLCSLAAIHVLDLSHNSISGGLPHCFNNITSLPTNTGKQMTGKLPEDFGNMKMLESLDLSRNRISGKIPSSFASLNFLSVLDLSHNNLSGRIPSGTQLQGFMLPIYGNRGLCGPPLTQSCPGEGTEIDNKEHDNDDSWTIAKDWIYVKTVVYKANCKGDFKDKWRFWNSRNEPNDPGVEDSRIIANTQVPEICDCSDPGISSAEEKLMVSET
ncbi:receptor-like protein EIX2 [Rosa chinensis]|uniref:receptor-like protein EIX2 n=1 Tax=Rosa chinensis TaxID=74649 RepID=UPI000D0897FC|nr:receptor-like protein EIX2 [Rosa chinensis]